MKLRFSRFMLLACLLCGVASMPRPALAAGSKDANAAEMGGGERKKQRVDRKLLKAFVKEYNAPDVDYHAIFIKYLPTLGADAILDYLEDTHPLCHGEAHPLGSALYELNQDLGASLKTCGMRCTSACMHGVIREGFKGKSVEDVADQLESFCKDGVMSQHKPGNCAHALGHALMIVSNRNVETSLSSCATYSHPGMKYYCATGVYMEYFISPPDPPADVLSEHYPCNVYALYPAACYRYKGPIMLEDYDDDSERFSRECLRLSGPRRLGCFHGVGAALRDRVAEEPAALGRGCSAGTADDQAMCIEGAMEKLADYKASIAEKACRKIDGARREVCLGALDGKMYRLDKPTMPLYTNASTETTVDAED